MRNLNVSNIISIKLDEKGMTLMELMIAIILLSIIAIAAFSGFQFAYNSFSSSHVYIGEVYDAQLEFENQLSYTFLHATDTEESDIETIFSLQPDEVESDPMEFDWGVYNSGVWSSVSPMDDFDIDGVTVILDSKGAEYLEIPINIYIPVDTEKH